MCGVAGIWNYRLREPVDVTRVRAMVGELHHRGPDDRGEYFAPDDGVGLGFARLSIIDLSEAGHQPMTSVDGSATIVFNGEIYNHQYLRSKMEGRGYSFRSRSDTEVLLAWYQDRGDDFLLDLTGMFGLGIWDSRRKSMILARDRVGKKPLYYFDNGTTLIFASELKSILTVSSVPRTIDLQSVSEYFELGYVRSPRTVLKSIQKLAPGHILRHDGRVATVRRYWDWLDVVQHSPKDHLSKREWADRIRVAVQEAVRTRLESDVPLGAFLSGGVDSSVVVSAMAEHSAHPIKTFSIGFHDEDMSELPFARLVAERFSTDHHEYIVEPESIADLLPSLVSQLDEPMADPSVLPTYYVSKIARQKVTVCLSGDGGDEVFAGYHRYAHALADRRADIVPDFIRAPLLRALLAVIPSHLRGYRRLRRYQWSGAARYVADMQVFEPDSAQFLLQTKGLPNTTHTSHSLMELATRSGALDLLAQVQYIDGMSYLPEDILLKVDRMSMMNSLETRCPLLDHNLIELAAGIPVNYRIHNRDKKHMLKLAFRGIVPEEILYRPKMGFGIPGDRWLRGDSASFVADVLNPSSVSQFGFLSSSEIHRQVQKLRLPGSRNWPQVWSILVFVLWCNEYLT